MYNSPMLDKAALLAADAHESEVANFRIHIQNESEAKLAIDASTRAEAEEEAEYKRMLKALFATQKVTKASPLAKRKERAHGGDRLDTQFFDDVISPILSATPDATVSFIYPKLMDAILEDINGKQLIFSKYEYGVVTYTTKKDKEVEIDEKNIRRRIRERLKSLKEI